MGKPKDLVNLVDLPAILRHIHYPLGCAHIALIPFQITPLQTNSNG